MVTGLPQEVKTRLTASARPMLRPRAETLRATQRHLGSGVPDRGVSKLQHALCRAGVTPPITMAPRRAPQAVAWSN